MKLKWRWSHFDLQVKTIILACLGLLFWLFTSFTVFFEIENLNSTVMNLELAEDLYDSIHEMRRYEKNFLLYSGKDNFDQAVSFFYKAYDIYIEMTKAPDQFKRMENEIRELGVDFKEYGHVVDFFKAGNFGNDISEELKARVRLAGTKMIDSSKKILILSRKKVTDKANKAIKMPLFATGVVIFLFFIGLIKINRKVIKPLVLLEQATGKIGRGDFITLSTPGKVENEVDRLVMAFNRMVEELDSRQEQVVHARKIASLGTLVSGVAHELNNPINNIILTVDSLLGKRVLTDEKKKEFLQDILDQGIRASEIVKNLLAFSRAEVSSLQPLVINSILKDIFKIVENDLKLKNIDRKIEIDELPEIIGNRSGLQQVFFNLITNAVQAMDKDGELKVRGFLDKNNWIIVEIQDTGGGINEEDIDHIFDPFFTTKEVGKGTGLGLSVSYGIIKKHGGRITVKTKPGVGTRFTVSLPAEKETINA